MNDLAPIKVAENPDGSFTLEWDENHPSLQFLNDMTPTEIEEWFIKAMKDTLKYYEDNPQADI
jgi:hypothetical protein